MCNLVDTLLYIKSKHVNKLERSLEAYIKVQEAIKEAHENNCYYMGSNYCTTSQIYSSFYNELSTDVYKYTGVKLTFGCSEKDFEKALEKLMSINPVKEFNNYIYARYDKTPRFVAMGYTVTLTNYNCHYHGLKTLCSVLRLIFNNTLLSEEALKGLDDVYRNRNKENTFIFRLNKDKECTIRFFKNGKTIIKFDSKANVDYFLSQFKPESEA